MPAVHRGPGHSARRQIKRPPKPDIDLIDRDLPERDPELLTSAKRFVDEDKELSQLSELLELRPAEWLERISDRLRTISREEHIRAVAFAYAIWLRITENPGYRSFVQNAIERRKRITKDTTVLTLILESVISYGRDDGDERTDGRRLYCRDAGAIRYLYRNKIGPSQIEYYSNQLGEGLNAWSRKWSKLNKEKKNGFAGAMPTEEQSLTVAVTWTGRRVGEAKGRQSFSIPLKDEGLLDEILKKLEMAKNGTSRSPRG